MPKFRILSLDGGGIRGAFTAAFLAELEKGLGVRLFEHFDLIAGTSTGGIIAAALALGEPAERIRAFYEGRGPAIFKRRLPAELPPMGFKARCVAKIARKRVDQMLSGYGLDVDYLLQSKYDSKELERALKEVFESRTLEHARTRLVIPAVDLSSGKTIVFKTPHLPHASSRDRHYLAVDVVLATTAAPTYFPHAVIRQGSAYCDGGLWANNPSMVAFAEAVKIRECCRHEDGKAPFELDDIWMLSVGTGESHTSLAPPESKAGLGWWGPRIVDVMSLAQSQGTKWLSTYVLGDRHHRVDYTIPDTSWKLDSIGMLERFFHFGRQEAHTQMVSLRPKFFDAPVLPYVPCQTQ